MPRLHLSARLVVALAVAVLIAQGHMRSQGPQGQNRPVPVPVLPLKQTAYVKASNAEAYDHFACGGGNQGHNGNAIVISGDGTTLAIWAPYESSGARGINGNQNDNSSYASGAVYSLFPPRR